MEPHPGPPASAGLRQLRLQFAGTCVRCSGALPRAAQALYDPSTKTVRCVECPVEDNGTAAETPIDRGVAGASAGREHERRRAKRERATKERYGNRLGGLILAITNEPQSTRAWAQGARGEAALAARLADLPDVVVLSDRRVPGTRGNIDLLVIARAGVFVVDAKRYKGLIRVRDRGGLFRSDLRLYIGGRDRSDLAEDMAWQVAAVAAVLTSAQIAVAITPVLCFIDGEWPFLRPPNEYRGVRLEGPRSLRELITRTRLLEADEIGRLARLLAAALPAR